MNCFDTGDVIVGTAAVLTVVMLTVTAVLLVTILEPVLVFSPVLSLVPGRVAVLKEARKVVASVKKEIDEVVVISGPSVLVKDIVVGETGKFVMVATSAASIDIVLLEPFTGKVLIEEA